MPLDQIDVDQMDEVPKIGKEEAQLKKSKFSEKAEVKKKRNIPQPKKIEENMKD